MFSPDYFIPAVRPLRNSVTIAGMRDRCVLYKQNNTANQLRGWFARLPVTAASIGDRRRQALLGCLVLLSCLALLTPILAKAARTPAGTAIDNIASASFQTGPISSVTMQSNLSRIITVGLNTPSTIEFLNYTTSSSGYEQVPVNVTGHSPSGSEDGPFSPLPAPTPFGSSTPVDLSALVPMNPTEIFHIGEPIFLRVTDKDQNQDISLAETIVVTVTSSDTGDREVLLLTETGTNTGVFTGYIPSNGDPAVTNNGTLSLVEDDTLTARYYDQLDVSDVATSAALVDPFGVVFDSDTGQLVNGATVTLIDTATGQPASVLGDDGVSSYPATVVTGSVTYDSSGRAYSAPDGGYRFPLIVPGTYRLEIDPPSGYIAPSTVPTSSLQSLPGAPYAIESGSRGEYFTVNPGPTVHIDIPVDPVRTGIWVQKEANKDEAAIGDFVGYTVRVENFDQSETAVDVVVTDRLPMGFRYQTGSTRLDAIRADDPEISTDGRTLTYRLGDLAPGAGVEIRYVTEIGTGTRTGYNRNSAAAQAQGGLSSNTASAVVTVREDFLRSSSLLMGRVMTGGCDKPDTELEGLGGVRIYLEDGTYVVSDQKGRYHFEGIDPGTHVVQVDLASLPPAYEPIACEENNQFAGRNFSQFVDIQGGTLWRADFHVKLKEKPKGEVSIELNSALDDDRVSWQIPLKISQVDLKNLRLSVILPKGLDYVAGSSRLGDQPIEDPGGKPPVLTYRLGDRPAGWQGEIILKTRVGEGAPQEMALRTVLTFNSPEQQNQRTPIVDNLIRNEGKRIDNTPILDLAKANSGLHKAETVGPRPGADGDLPEKDLPDPEQMPVYDKAWLERVGSGSEWLWPQPGKTPAIPSIKVAIKHAAGLKVKLRLDGREVSPLAFEGTTANQAGSTAVSIWRGIGIKKGDNNLTADLYDANGKLVEQLTRLAHYSFAPAYAELVKEQSTLVADGKTAPVIAVRLTDRDGYPVSSGMIGEFSVEPPYSQWIDKSEENHSLDTDKPKYQVGPDGVARIILEPTPQSGEAVIHLPLEDETEEISAWLKPVAREWILVGFAEGTLGYNTLSGNQVSLDEAGVDEHLYEDGRIKFFAKGAIKGEWLLTVAYDSDKKELDGDSLEQIIDPDTYYPLYGDETQQNYEAASARKIYVKLERNQFYALFGDMQTGLTRTELSRYSRSMNGLKSELQGENFEFNLFAADTRQGFVKDEIRGDGTSGRYYLSHQDLVINSETIVIETRDRLQSEKILSSQTMQRHIDYNIDYGDGTLFFKRPIASKDESFNPIFIVADYETKISNQSELNYGGRAAVKLLDQKLEVGASLIHENSGVEEGDLYGVDATITFDSKNSLRLEAATTDTEDASLDQSGEAYLVEYVHTSSKLQGSVYFREQDEEFGLGQQNGSESGTRKYGAEGTYRITDEASISALAYHEDNLTTDAERDVVELGGDLEYDRFSIHGGLRDARDTLGDGSSKHSQQLLTGGNWTTADRKLTLRAQHEQSLSGKNENTDYPTQTLFGADYRISKQVSLFAEQDFSWGDDVTSEGTRAGFKASPWRGSDAQTTIERQLDENGERIFALFGLGQTWQVSENWSVDASLDRSYTIKEAESYDFDVDVPDAHGSDEDFTSVSLGATYQQKTWSWDNRLEVRYGDDEDKYGVISSLIGQVRKGMSASARYTGYYTDSAEGATSNEQEVTLGLAYRPRQSRWIILNRLDAIYERDESSEYDDKAWRLVNNLQGNYKPNRRWQIAPYYGFKYVQENINGSHYDGFTDLVALETRYNLNSRWDLGLHGSMLHSWNSGQFDYSSGASIGYLFANNLWASLGYNFMGFQDDDFSQSTYTASGVYLKLRLKFDQHTVIEALEWLNRQ